MGPLVDVASAFDGDVVEILQSGRRQGLFEAVLRELGAHRRPTVLVIEDVQWADESTLDLVRYLGRRVSTVPALILVTIREDELHEQHPLRMVLGDLASATAVRRLAVSPLSEAAVRVLAADSAVDPVALHRDTGGNPFFVTEVLASGDPGVPAVVADAVMARVSRLSSAARRALEAAAVIGARIEPSLALSLDGIDATALDECAAAGMLRFTPPVFTFRHELARQAVVSGIPAQRQARMHAEVLARLRSGATTPDMLARLADHAEEAGDADAVVEFAPAAAELAAGLKAHRQAEAQYARVLRFASAALPMEHRALLLEAHSHECYLTEQIAQATDSRRAALEIWKRLGNRPKSGESLRWLSRLFWFAGRNEEAEQTAAEALEILEAEPPGSQLAWAFSNLSQLRMLSQDTDAAVAWGEKAISLAEQLGETEILVHALNNVGAARMLADEEGGREQLERSLAMAKAAGFEEHVSRALANLVAASLRWRNYKLADGYLHEGISYANEHNFDYKRLHLIVGRAESHLYQGRWAEASEDAASILCNPDAVPPVRIMALEVAGRQRARRGDPDVWSALDEALLLAAPTGELQQIGQVRAARAEAAWLEGRPAEAIAEAQAGLEIAAGHRDPWLIGELALWLWRAGGLADASREIAEPMALEISGHSRAAAERWYELGCPYEAGQALATTDEEVDLRRALAEFERLGARPGVAAVARRLRTLGARGIPRGPRPATRANPANLTARELQVLDLMALGLGDAKIADRLFLSPRTVGHHVSSILGKLGVRSRAEASLVLKEGELLQRR